MDSRHTALNIVHDVIYKDKYSNMVLESYMNKSGLSVEDRRLCMNISMGVLRNSIYLEHILKPYIKNIKKTSPLLLCILKIGIYQFMFMDKIPQYAIVDESCNLAKKIISKNSAGFVNAVLRNFIRKNKVEDNNLESHIKYSCTKEAYKAMRSLLSEEQCIEMLKKFNSPQDTYISINTHFHNKDEVISNMQKQGFDIEITDNTSILVKGNSSPSSSDEYSKGAIIVQDELAVQIAKLLNVQNNMTVLDACASPGGKTIYLANTMENTGNITACDIVQSRISKTIENIERCGFTNIKCQVMDMTEYYPEYENAFDRVLIDAPCSGLGVAGKRPEIKLKYKSSDSLTKTQKALIKTCSRYVKKDGYLVYGTCTINRQENQDIVEGFLSENNEYGFEEDFFDQGFYAARLIRK